MDFSPNITTLVYSSIATLFALFFQPVLKGYEERLRFLLISHLKYKYPFLSPIDSSGIVRIFYFIFLFFSLWITPYIPVLSNTIFNATYSIYEKILIIVFIPPFVYTGLLILGYIVVSVYLSLHDSCVIIKTAVQLTFNGNNRESDISIIFLLLLLGFIIVVFS